MCIYTHFVIFFSFWKQRKTDIIAKLTIRSFRYLLFCFPLVVSQTSIRKLYKRLVVSKPSTTRDLLSWHGTPVVSLSPPTFMAIKSYKSIVLTTILFPHTSIASFFLRDCILLLRRSQKRKKQATKYKKKQNEHKENNTTNGICIEK